MPKQRALTGVAHNIAHHAQSGLSWLHPHLFNACRNAGLQHVRIDLLQSDPYPTGLPAVEPLRLALVSLQLKFWEILARERFARATVESVSLDVQFPAAGGDGYSCAVHATVTATDGQTYQSVVQ
jgi:hypothetical protein